MSGKFTLDTIRAKERTHTVSQQILITIGMLLFGICLGTFSKYLEYQPEYLPMPHFMEVIDEALNFHNFLSTFAPWVILAVCIAVYSHTPFRAAVNVFVFFAGMVSGYYVYCNYVAGFFPKSYALIWVGFTILSPFLAFICWYAKGKGVVAIIISAGILGFLMDMAFYFGWLYLSVSSVLELIVLFIAILVLWRPMKEMIAMLGLGIIFAIVFDIVIPFGF